MPRPFIPCIYHEWEAEHPLVALGIHRRYNAMELFDICWLDSHETDVLMTSNSHQYHVSTTESHLESLQAPVIRDVHAQWARERLFRTFYEELA